MKQQVKYLLVQRLSDGKVFSIGHTVTSDGGIFRGVIDGMQQFEDDFRVHLNVDPDSGDPEYWSISELD